MTSKVSASHKTQHGNHSVCNRRFVWPKDTYANNQTLVEHVGILEKSPCMSKGHEWTERKAELTKVIINIMRDRSNQTNQKKKRLKCLHTEHFAYERERKKNTRYLLLINY